MKRLIIIGGLVICSFARAQENKLGSYRKDFDYFWTTIRDNYSYWDKVQTDWDKVKSIYNAQIDTVHSRNSFVLLLEKLFYELYDHHASLNTNTAESQRLVPSGSDIWAEYINGHPVILEVKKGSGAEKAGIKPGMQVIAFNDINVSQAIKPFLPRSLKKPDIEASNYALRVLLAGRHDTNRKIRLEEKGIAIDYFPDDPVNLLEQPKDQELVDGKILSGNIGYIIFNNSLGDNDVIHVFDSLLIKFKNTRALILDLRETPGGGNTTVARAIMGHFIDKEAFYQKHELPGEEREFGIKRSWMEIVSPVNPLYTKKLVILVNHWTGSIAEGITIGFDALKKGTIIGTQMAGLKGAVYSFQMPATGIFFSFPAEKLFTTKGKPRENFKPHILIDISRQKPGEDLVLERAIKFLEK